MEILNLSHKVCSDKEFEDCVRTCECGVRLSCEACYVVGDELVCRKCAEVIDQVIQERAERRAKQLVKDERDWIAQNGGTL